MATTPRTRLGVTALALLALGGSFGAGVAVGRDHEPSGRQVAAGPKLPLGTAPGSLVRAGSCEELLAWYVDNTVDLVTPWGWGSPMIAFDEDGLFGNGSVEGDLGAPVPASPPRSPSDGVTSSETGTNVQEAGVDEPDVVKTDGELLVRVEGDDLTTYDVSGAKPRRLSTIDMPGSAQQNSELLLAGDQVLVVSKAGPTWSGSTPERPSVVVHRVDLSTPAEPEVVGSQEYGAEVISARLYADDTVRLVLRTGLPALDFVEPGDGRSDREARRENQRIVRRSTIEDWLPSVSDDGAEPEPAVGCDAMTRPEDFSGGGSLVVVGHDASSPAERSSIGVATSSELVYSSTDRLYLATSQAWGLCCVIMDGIGREGWGGRVAPDFADDGTTELHAFELTGTTAAYAGSGEVEGFVADRWSMDAVDGTLRVAVGPTSETGNFNSVVTLQEKDGRLVELGRVDRLGVNEQIKSVRWFDDLAIVVTFRQTDPLYAIDLSDPARPRRLGALKIPGFSEYLHPIGDDRLIGIGTSASLDGVTRGGQAAVFDLSDPADPRRLSKLDYGARRSTLAGQDPRQFTWLPDRRTALTVVSEYGKAAGAVGWVSVLEVGADGALTNTMVRGTYGYDDVAHLRTVPLPDGRVVLVTEDTARFLRW